MDTTDFYSKLNELLELPEGTVNGTTRLAELAEWDSLAVIGFIAMADTEYGATVLPQRIAQCRTAADLCALVSEVAVQPAG